MWILEEVIHTFKENDRVYVTAKSTSYKGKHAGKSGVVANVYMRDDGSCGNIAVLLDKEKNKASQFGLFYFKVEELQIAPHEAIASSGHISCISSGVSISREDTILKFDSMALAEHVFEKMNLNGDNKNIRMKRFWICGRRPAWTALGQR